MQYDYNVCQSATNGKKRLNISDYNWVYVVGTIIIIITNAVEAWIYIEVVWF